MSLLNRLTQKSTEKRLKEAAEKNKEMYGNVSIEAEQKAAQTRKETQIQKKVAEKLKTQVEQRGSERGS